MKYELLVIDVMVDPIVEKWRGVGMSGPSRLRLRLRSPVAAAVDSLHCGDSDGH